MLFSDGGASIFDEPICAWSIDQIQFMNWAKYYNVHYYSLPEDERPNDKIFKYSALLDQFVEKKAFKKKEKERKNRQQNKGKGGGQSMKWEF